jgi:hypothetical protein
MHLHVFVGAVAEKLRASGAEVGKPGDVLPNSAWSAGFNTSRIYFVTFISRWQSVAAKLKGFSGRI